MALLKEYVFEAALPSNDLVRYSIFILAHTKKEANKIAVKKAKKQNLRLVKLVQVVFIPSSRYDDLFKSYQDQNRRFLDKS